MDISHFKTHLHGLSVHTKEVQFIDALAVLIGCKEALRGLPDGKLPDVIRADTKRGVLFIGDAKNTELPECLETQARLMTYLEWLSAYVRGRNGKGVVAICFTQEKHEGRWVRAIESLLNEANLYYSDFGIEKFDGHFNVLWFLIARRNTKAYDL